MLSKVGRVLVEKLKKVFTFIPFFRRCKVIMEMELVIRFAHPKKKNTSMKTFAKSITKSMHTCVCTAERIPFNQIKRILS